MTLEIKHKFVSPKGDGPDSTRVKPSAWNDEHNFSTDAQGIVLGRDTTGSGDIQELPLGIDPDGSLQVAGTGQLAPPKGTTAERPAVPLPGAMRFNLDDNTIEVYGLSGTTGWTKISVLSFLAAGSIVGFPKLPIAAGFIIMNGQAVSRADNPGLFTYLGIDFGPGDGSTTFNVPNWTGRAPVQFDPTGAVLGTNIDPNETFGGLSNSITLNMGHIPAHQHGLPNGQTGNTTPSTGGGNVTGTNPGGATDFAGSGSPTPLVFGTLQPSIGAIWSIKGG